MAQRFFVCGFEGGPTHFGSNTPSTGDITVQSVIKRTGNYALRVNAQSGVSTSVLCDTAQTQIKRLFFRGYLYISSAPSVTRTLLRFGTNFAFADFAELRLTSTRHVAICNNGVVKATGTTQLPLNTFVRVEMAVDSVTRTASVRIDGGTEIDWVEFATTGNQILTTLALGAADTVASAFDVYWDDVVLDGTRWCGPGEVRRLDVNSVTAAADWTVTGAANAVSALQSVDDDTSYVACSGTVIGQAQALQVGVDSAGLGATVIRGVAFYTRHRLVSTAQNIDRIWSAIGLSAVASTVITPLTTSYSWSRFWHRSDTPVSWRLDVERLSEMRWGLYPQALGGGLRLSSAHIEVDVDTTANARPDPHRVFLASCDTGDTSEFTDVQGAPVASTTRVRTGIYSVATPAAPGVECAVRWLTDTGFEGGAFNEIFIRVYAWFESYPSTGTTVEFVHAGSGFNVQRAFGVLIDHAGHIAFTDGQFANPTPVNGWSSPVIPTGRWVKLDLWAQRQTVPDVLTGRMKFWIDDLLAHSTDAADISGIGAQGLYVGLMNNDSLTALAWYWDDFAIDLSARPENSKVLDMTPVATGVHTGTWTPTGAPSSAEAIDEAPTDDDVSYVLSPLSTNIADRISFTLPNLPAGATVVQHVQLAVRHKRHGAANGAIQYGLRTNNQTTGLAAIAPAAAYAWARRQLPYTDASGEWTPGLFNGSELVLGPNQATNASRVSNFRLTVEYNESSIGTLELIADGIVSSVGTLNLLADGIVSSVSTLELMADGIVIDESVPSIPGTQRSVVAHRVRRMLQGSGVVG